MSDATHGLPNRTPDPDFGRYYQYPGEVLPRLELRLGRGWWFLPMLGGGIVGWGILIHAILF